MDLSSASRRLPSTNTGIRSPDRRIVPAKYRQVFSLRKIHKPKIVDKIITATTTLARYLWHMVGEGAVSHTSKSVRHLTNNQQPANTTPTSNTKETLIINHLTQTPYATTGKTVK